ncbi:hypothetical protein AB4Z30_28890 [Paenibacillus sp. 2TAF8]|uniref:hypothetical protein n=1 Tax=Paenibacillus sp. 2TAF8 TaxID=3233020 RepID=UPI003F9AB915
MEVYDLGNFNKAVVWKGKAPIVFNQTAKELKTVIHLNQNLVSTYTQIVMELKLARNSSYYALLGVEYIPEETSELLIKVEKSNNEHELYCSALGPKEIIYTGIPGEYADAIMIAAKKKIQDAHWKYSGSIVFGLGAHSVVGSSESVFSKITEILMVLLMNEFVLNSPWSDKNIIKEELLVT